MKGLCVALVSLVLACQPAPSPSTEKPFVSLTFDAALAEAKRADKVVMIDFFTTWCGPCKKLDRVTWKDPEVVKWLGEHAVAMKVDAEKNVELAKRFQVNAYPTMVFVDGGGKEVERLLGYYEPPAFLEKARGLRERADRKAAIDKVLEKQ
jgi:thiol:disulfide interchange protein